MADIRTLEGHFLPWAKAFLDVLDAARVPYTVTSTRRSYTEQSRLYRAYTSGQSALPAAVPGTSLHEWGLAMDLAFSDPRHYSILGKYWEKNGLGKWGGHFKDPVHFEANAAVKKAAGWSKGRPYEGGTAPGVETAYDPVELFIKSNPLTWFLPLDYWTKLLSK